MKNNHQLPPAILTTSPVKTILLLLMILLAFGISSIQAQSGIEGKWQTNEGGVILIYEEDGQYFGKVVSAANPDQNQKLQEHGEVILLRNFKKKSDTKFCCGKVYQPKMKKTLSGTLTLQDENTLKIKAKYGILSGSQIWERAPDELK